MKTLKTLPAALMLLTMLIGVTTKVNAQKLYAFSYSFEYHGPTSSSGKASPLVISEIITLDCNVSYDNGYEMRRLEDS